ncbi:MAG: hypothetical protein ACPGDA_04440 [Paracoccaceae bacterium]
MLHSLPDLEDALPVATAGFTQSAGFEQALRALGQSVARIDGQLFISRRFPILGPVGYCAKPAYIPASILSGASPQGMAQVLINAATPAQGAALARAGFLRLAKPRHSLSMPLTQNTAKMVARLHPKWRAARKTALQRGAVARIRPFYTPSDGWLLAAEAAQRKRNHYDGIALALLAEIGRSKTQNCFISARGCRGRQRWFSHFQGMKRPITLIGAAPIAPMAATRCCSSRPWNTPPSGRSILIWG